MSHTVQVDQDMCLSSGRCVAEAPGAFAFDDDELAVPLTPTPGLSEAQLRSIVRGCPSGAITVQDAQGVRVA